MAPQQPQRAPDRANNRQLGIVPAGYDYVGGHGADWPGGPGAWKEPVRIQGPGRRSPGPANLIQGLVYQDHLVGSLFSSTGLGDKNGQIVSAI